MAQVWRLILDGAAPGPWNMAVDRALLASAIEGSTPTLRFYTWRGPWLSLGYGQPRDPRRLAACRSAGVGVVRRPTGGRAVLHGGDLTYALAASETLFPAGLHGSYRLVADALLEAMRSLGVPVQRSGPTSSGPRTSFDCFARLVPNELCAEGRKLVGSAQRRCAGGVLQHGSLRVFPDSPSARVAVGRGAGAATSLRELGIAAPLEAVRDRCAEALAAVLGARLEPGHLEPAERAWVDRHLGSRVEAPVIESPRSEAAVPGI